MRCQSDHFEVRVFLVWPLGYAARGMGSSWSTSTFWMWPPWRSSLGEYVYCLGFVGVLGWVFGHGHH
eukprot:3972274-Pyramimonas_sp.AAC.1